MDSLRRGIPRLAPSVLLVLAIHFAVLGDYSRPRLAALAAVCLFNVLIAALGGAGRHVWAGWLLAAAATGGLTYLSDGADLLAAAFYLSPILVNGALLWVFGRTLLPGREALIARMTRLEVGEMSPELARYTRILTASWAGFFVLSLIASIVLAIEADRVVWSWSINLGMPALAVLFFLGEHVYRVPRFGEQAPTTPVQTLRAALRPAAWTVGS